MGKLTKARLCVLHALRDARWGELSFASIVLHAGVSPFAVNKVVRDLCDAGLVDRSIFANTRFAQITPAGRALLSATQGDGDEPQGDAHDR